MPKEAESKWISKAAERTIEAWKRMGEQKWIPKAAERTIEARKRLGEQMDPKSG